MMNFKLISLKFTSYFDNGSLEQEGAYDNNGTYTGIWQWYYKNGIMFQY